ncbi:MAG TPA: ATP-binding protein [Ktedonobacterales bacterium]
MRDERDTQLDDALRQAESIRSTERATHAPSYWQKIQERWPVVSVVSNIAGDMRVTARRVWRSRLVSEWRRSLVSWRDEPYSGPFTLIAGTAIITVLALLSTRFFPIPSLGAIYIPLIAMLAYYWSWPLGIIGVVVQFLCVYFLLLPPAMEFKPLDAEQEVQMLVLAAISIYVLLLVQVARNRRDAAVREVGRFAAMNAVGTALSGELHEAQLLRLIAGTACDLTGASFAAFTLRPVDAMGHPLGPSEGSHFHLAAVVGVTPEQEESFRRIPLGGEGLLAPIFRYGVTVRVDDALTHLPPGHHAYLAYAGTGNASSHLARRASTAGQGSPLHAPSRERSAKHQGQQGQETGNRDSVNVRRESRRDAARRVAASFAHGTAEAEDLRAVGVPRGHPIVRSFLGAPLLDREGNVRGGLLLGHNEPNRFTKDDETLLKALAAQASVAIENARLYHNAESQAEELSAVFESIADGVMVYDHQGNLIHENQSASVIRSLLHPSLGAPGGNPSIDDVLTRLAPGESGSDGSRNPSAHVPFSLRDAHGDVREYLVSVSPLRRMSAGGELAALTEMPDLVKDVAGGTVVVWHEVTETHKLIAEQQARAEAEARRMLLQKVIDEQPSGVYLVRGHDATLVLANHAAQEVWGAHWSEGQAMEDFLAHSGVQMVTSGGRPLDASETATVRAVRSGEGVSHFEEVVRRPDGTSLPVLLNAVVLAPGMLGITEPMTAATDRGRKGMEHGALVVLQDVTAIKEAERLKDEFIAIAAHELKTPMAAVKGYADMLVRNTQHEESAALASWQVEALETIDQATNRLVELTEDLLDVARLQAERIQLHVEPHDLISLARRVMKRFQMASTRHTLSLVAQDEFVVASLDVRRTEQIIGNLLSNAIKYSPEGGSVTITIEQDDEAGLAKLSVSDQGIGIPANQQSILFNRFARADNARERGITGTGLGLYLCRELVELQGGHLWFASEEGCGSTFYMTLPLAQESE